MRKLIGWIGILLVAAGFCATFVAYFVTRPDPLTHTIADGFGRSLSTAPLLARLIFGQERLWAGWVWFIADMVLFWGSLAAGYAMASWGLAEQDAD